MIPQGGLDWSVICYVALPRHWYLEDSVIPHSELNDESVMLQ